MSWSFGRARAAALGGAGYSAVEAYLPAKRASVAVVVTFTGGSFASDGNVTNYGKTLYQQIGAILVRGQSPPTPK